MVARGAALGVGHSGGDGVGDEGADVLEDGHGLLAVDDVLDGGDFRVLAGDVVLLDVLVGAEGVGDGARGAVVRGVDEYGALVGLLSGSQVGLGLVLGVAEGPVGGDLADDAPSSSRVSMVLS